MSQRDDLAMLLATECPLMMTSEKSCKMADAILANYTLKDEKDSAEDHNQQRRLQDLAKKWANHATSYDFGDKLIVYFEKALSEAAELLTSEVSSVRIIDRLKKIPWLLAAAKEAETIALSGNPFAIPAILLEAYEKHRTETELVLQPSDIRKVLFRAELCLSDWLDQLLSDGLLKESGEVEALLVDIRRSIKVYTNKV